MAMVSELIGKHAAVAVQLGSPDCWVGYVFVPAWNAPAHITGNVASKAEALAACDEWLSAVVHPSNPNWLADFQSLMPAHEGLASDWPDNPYRGRRSA